MQRGFQPQKREKGFILIVAVTILMGLLAVVTTLVRMSKDTTEYQENFLKTNQSMNSVLDTGIAWVEYIFRNRSSTSGASPQPYSRLQQNWWGFGTQGIPFSLILTENVTDGETAIDVETMRHVFMALAVNSDTGTALDTSDMYVIENEQLLLGTTKVGGGVNFNINGGMGMGTQRFGISTAMQRGYISIDERWLRVDSWTITPTTATLNIGNTDLRDDNSEISGETGDAITYYPFDPALDIGRNQGAINITFEDEAGKVNINSLTDAAISALGFNVDNYRDAMNLSTSYAPHRNYQGISHRSGANNFNGLVDDQQYTPFSKSLITRDVEAYVHRGHVATNEMLSINSTSASPSTSWSQSGTRDRHFVIRHPLNVNSANRKALRTYFETVLGDSTDSARDLSLSVVEYRYNDYTLDRYIPNPFDGVDNTDQNNRVYYSGPEEEFRAFLLNRDGTYSHNLSNVEIKSLMAHAYNEAHDLGYKIDPVSSANRLCQPIGFEWDDTWKVNVIATSGYVDRPSSTRTKNMVVVPVNRTATGVIHINSATGWNRAYSTFNGVTRKQPTVIYDGASPDQLIIDESNLDRSQFGYFHVNGGMVAKVGNSSSAFQILSFLKNSDDVSTQGNLVYAIDRAGLNMGTELGVSKTIDLGIRPISRDREDMGDRYGANVTISGNYGVGAMTIYADNNVEPSDTSQWTNQWLVFGDNVASPEHVRVSSVAGNAITLATALDFSLSPGDRLYMIPEFHPDYFGEAESSADHPFYETVVHVPGAHEFTVTWNDSGDHGGQNVTAAWYAGTDPDTASTISSGDTIPNVDNFIRLRFSFDSTAGGVTDPASVPQLFGIRINYSIRSDAPPMYVLHRN